MLSLSLRHTFTTAGTDCHRLASPEYPFPLDNRVVHLGLEDLEEAVFTDLLACLWSLDEGAGGVAERAGRRCHFWCRNKMIEKCQNKGNFVYRFIMIVHALVSVWHGNNAHRRYQTRSFADTTAGLHCDIDLLAPFELNGSIAQLLTLGSQ